MRYDEMNLEARRKKLEIKISSLMSYTFKAIGCSNQELIGKLDDLIDSIDDIIVNSKETEIQKLLGGEFNKDIIYKGGDFFPEQSSIPLYFSLDLIIRSLETNYLDNMNLNNELILRLRKLAELKEYAKNLQYNEIFNPQDEFDTYTIEEIISSKGNFELGHHTKEGVRFLSIVTKWSHTPGYAKNGDYYQTGPTTSGSSDPMPLYKKDIDEINNKRHEKLQQKKVKVDAIAKKYFIDGKIPTTSNFHYNLKDQNLDRRIIMALFSISIKRDKCMFEGELYGQISYELQELENVEKIVELLNTEKMQIQKRNTSIEAARKRYKEKNFLWKLFNKKISPKNQNFDDMTDEEINALYKGKRG